MARTEQETVLRGVQRAWRAVRFAHQAEALLVGLGAGLGTLAAAGFDGVHPTERDALCVAGFVALAIGVAWITAHREAPERVARRIDHRHRLDGALVAAWEQADQRGGLAELLARRVVRRAPPASWVQRALPNSTPWVVVPLVAGLLLAQSVPATHGNGAGRGDPIELLRGMQGHLERAKSAGLDAPPLPDGTPGLDPAALRDLMRSAQAGRSVRPQAEDVDDWLAEASGLLPRLPEGSAARDAFEQALALGEAAALALDAERGPSLDATEDPEPTGPTADVDRPEGERLTADPPRPGASSSEDDPVRLADGSADPGGSTGGGDVASGVPDPDSGRGAEPVVAGGGTDGTMSGQRSPEDLPGPDPPTVTGAERGLVGGRWWSDRDAALVRRWVEAVRTDERASPRDGSPP